MIEDNSLIKLLKSESAPILKKLLAQNCQAAVTDETLKALAALEGSQLEFLDISYNKMVTDEGLGHFEGKTFPIKVLKIQGLLGVTGAGLYHLVWACHQTLEVINASQMDQEGMNVSEWGKALGNCY